MSDNGTAFVVRTPASEKALNSSLTLPDKAYSIWDARLGMRHDKIIVLAHWLPENSQINHWFEGFKCCLTPDGTVHFD